MKNELIGFLYKKFGEDVAKCVWKEFGGSQIYIPLMREKGAREEYVLKHQGNKTPRQIASELNITVRTVQNIMNRRIKPSQVQLFE